LNKRSCSNVMTTKTSTVVIIGGGFAGCKVAQLLLSEPNFHVTLIDPSDFLEVAWVNPRALVSIEWAQRSLVPYSTFLRGNFQHVKDEAMSLETQKVTTTRSGAVAFDYCVIAVGSSYAGFLKAAASTTTAGQRLSELHSHSEQLKAAASVLVVGGGPSGVELAFEILDVYPSKKVRRARFGVEALLFSLKHYLSSLSSTHATVSSPASPLLPVRTLSDAWSTVVQSCI
jgi:NADH dehydrogenase FAD-containing subunit